MAQLLVCDECSEPFERPFLQVSCADSVQHYHIECMVWPELYGKLRPYVNTMEGTNHLDVMVLIPPDILEKQYIEKHAAIRGGVTGIVVPEINPSPES